MGASLGKVLVLNAALDALFLVPGIRDKLMAGYFTNYRCSPTQKEPVAFFQPFNMLPQKSLTFLRHALPHPPLPQSSAFKHFIGWSFFMPVVCIV